MVLNANMWIYGRVTREWFYIKLISLKSRKSQKGKSGISDWILSGSRLRPHRTVPIRLAPGSTGIPIYCGRPGRHHIRQGSGQNWVTTKTRSGSPITRSRGQQRLGHIAWQWHDVAGQRPYIRCDALLYLAYVMLIWAAPIPADRWHCSLWP